MWGPRPFRAMLPPAATPQPPPAIGVRAHGGPQGGVEDCGEPGGLHAHIAGLMGRTHIRMLCDTVSSCNCVYHAFYNQHLVSMTPLNKPPNHKHLVAAGGSALTTAGEIKVSFKLGGCVLFADFFCRGSPNPRRHTGRVEFFE